MLLILLATFLASLGQKQGSLINVFIFIFKCSKYEDGVFYLLTFTYEIDHLTEMPKTKKTKKRQQLKFSMEKSIRIPTKINQLQYVVVNFSIFRPIQSVTTLSVKIHLGIHNSN